MKTFLPVEPALLRWEKWLCVLDDEMMALDRAFVSARGSEKVAGHVAALTAAMLALKRAPGFEGELITLRDLQSRLEKLLVGQKRPIMAVVDSVKVPGRPPGSSSERAREAHAVAFVQFAISRGWSERDACELLAKEFARVGVKGHNGGSLQLAAVMGWLGKIKQTNNAYKLATALLKEAAPSEFSVSSMRKFVRRFIENSERIGTKVPS